MSVLDANPFDVLGVPAAATRGEIERAAQRLLAQLEVGAASVRAYATPVGERPRTADGVRTALETLRDPAGRIAAELLADARPDPSGAWPTLPPWRRAKERLLGGPDTPER